MIAYPCFGRTSAKGNRGPHPRRAVLECPVCGDRFTLNHAEYRKYVAKGLRPCCSRVCGHKYRVIREHTPAGAVA